MIESKRVRLADIMPDENNPRQAFEGLEELAAQFELTPERPGEPFTPPIVVQDGNRYRLVDGERRFRAMVQAGKVDSCLCNVCDSMEDASAVAMMLATDSKEQLSDSERAQGVQQMLILGVPFEQVESAARLKRGQASKAAKALSAQRGDLKPLQTDMRVLMEVGEVEDASVRAELVEMIEGGCDTDWGSDFRRKLRVQEQVERNARDLEGMREAATEMRLRVVDGCPEGMSKLYSPFNADALRDAVEDALDDRGFQVSDLAVGFEPGGSDADNYGKVRPAKAILYAPRAEDEDEPSEAELERERVRERKAELGHAWDEVRAAWLDVAVANASKLGGTALGDMVCEVPAVDDAILDRIRAKVTYQPWMLAMAWDELIPSTSYLIDLVAVGKVHAWYEATLANSVARLRKLHAALEPFGWHPSPVEAEALAAFDAMEACAS